MSSANRIVKNTGYLYVKTFVSMFVMLYVTRIVLRTLGSEDFGIYDVVGGAISMLGFLNTSMANTIQRFLNNAQGKNNKELQRKVFNIGVVFHVTIGVVMILIFVLLYFILFNGVLNISPERTNAAKIVYLCLVVSTFLNIITVPYDASINAHEDLLTYSIIGIIDIFLKLGVAIAISQSSMDKLILYAVLMMLVPIATYIMMSMWCTKRYEECHISVRDNYDKDVARQMLSFSGWSLLGTSSNLVGNYGNSIVLNHFFGTTLNAVAGIANQFQGMLIVLSNGMLRSLNPVIYKTGSNDTNKMMNYSYKGCKYSFILLAILAFPIVTETSYILNIWLGEVPEWTVLFVRLQLLRCLLEQLTTTFDKSLASVGKIKEINLFSLLFNISPIIALSIVYSLGVPPYWHFIVAIFFMVILLSIVKVYLCHKYCALNLRSFISEVLLPCTGISIITLPLLSLVNTCFEGGSVRVILVILVSSIAILSAGYLFMSSVERNNLVSLSKSLKNYSK